jgi:RNA polymerase sigma-70 factor, ECF subfamily
VPPIEGVDPAVQTDEDLVVAVALGDQDAYRLLVTRYQDAIWRVAWRYTGNVQDAQDICQTVFLKLYEAAPRFRMHAAFRTYLFRIANNACIDHCRRRRPEVGWDSVEAVDTAPLPDQAAETRERTRRLQCAIARLSERQRRAVVLKYEADLPVQEIAAAMGITRKAVERLLAHARAMLRRMIVQDIRCAGDSAAACV